MLKSSSLYRNLLAFQIYGANTEVGKTIFSTILCKALEKRHPTRYLKPVSTGPDNEADNSHVGRFAKDTQTKCLYQFGEAVSPHIAAAASNPPTDSEVVDGVLQYMQECSKSGFGSLIVETAGGVHSPTPSGSSQADLYRPLRLPVWLVADPKLGGISSTISAYESLHIRGYDLDSILVFENDKYRNHDYLREFFHKKGVQAISIRPPPQRLQDVKDDEQSMSEYYEKMSKSHEIAALLNLSHHRHDQRIERLDIMSTKAVDKIWYPFTQHKDISPEKILTMDSAYGDFFQTTPPTSNKTATAKETTEPSPALLRSTFDASASWWTQGLGHGSPSLSLAAAYAAGRYGHVMFAGGINEPALNLAETLLTRLGNLRLQKVFYSDNGSTGMEVALKMALTAASKRYNYDSAKQGEVGVLGLKGSYHGDTIGAMDASEGSTYNEKVHWYKGRGYWFDFPQIVMKKGKWMVQFPDSWPSFGAESEETFNCLGEIFDINRDNGALQKRYAEHIEDILQQLSQEGKKFAALVMEPIILGAGGMQFCDPLFQRTLANTVRTSPSLTQNTTSTDNTQINTQTWTGLPVIHDEVFTGLYRLGHFTPSKLLHIEPDISVHAKLLTGGLLPLCTTLASNSIYDAFIGDTKAEALLHGHSYTAHAIGCEVARTSLQEMIDLDRGGRWKVFKDDWKTTSTTSISSLKTSTVTHAGSSTTPELWSSWSQSFIISISHKPQVESVIALGSVLAITLKDTQGAGYSSNVSVGVQKALLELGEGRDFNVHSRILGNVVYFMASLVSEVAHLRAIEGRLEEVIGSLEI